MPLPPHIQEMLVAGRFDAVEDAWLEHIAGEPDVELCGQLAEALIEVEEGPRARMLLGLLADELAERGLWLERLEFLRRSGSTIYSHRELHAELLRSLEGAHSDRENLDALIDSLKLRRPGKNLNQTWEGLDRLEALLSYDVGAVVKMKGKGVGRVVDVNVALESLKIDFERHSGLMVGFRAAAKLLQPLGTDHVLRRKLEEPDALEELAAQDPPELLRLALESYDRALTANEIKTVLAGVVDEQRWTSWWAAARKHPQVLTESKGRASYRWMATSEDALASVKERFAAAELDERLELLRKEGGRQAELRQWMADELAAAAESLSQDSPEEAVQIWLELDRLGAAPPDVDWSAPALLAAQRYPARTIAAIGDRRLREAAYKTVRQELDEWPQVYGAALDLEPEPRLLDLLAAGLETDHGDDLERFFASVLKAHRKNPAAFVWVAERAGEVEALRQRYPLMLLRKLLDSTAAEEFAPYRARLRPMCDSGGTLPRLLKHLDADQAAEAERAIERAQLDVHLRGNMISALHLRFPELRQEDESPLYAMPESIEARRAELKHLLEVEIPANRTAIEEARALGDLSENFEYKSARQRHEYLSARTASIAQDLERARPIGLTGLADATEARIGSRVVLEHGGKELVFTILGPWESAPENGIISYESELARKILGKAVGDEVPVGEDSYRLQELGPADPGAS